MKCFITIKFLKLLTYEFPVFCYLLDVALSSSVHANNLKLVKTTKNRLSCFFKPGISPPPKKKPNGNKMFLFRNGFFQRCLVVKLFQ